MSMHKLIKARSLSVSVPVLERHTVLFRDGLSDEINLHIDAPGRTDGLLTVLAQEETHMILPRKRPSLPPVRMLRTSFCYENDLHELITRNL